MRLTRRRLNRATLARQSLLERTHTDVVTMVEQLGALQAQEPASPYLALWTRLEDHHPEDLTTALHERRLIKATLHRSTLHIVSADDYRASVTALLAVTRTKWMHETRGLPVVRTLPELAERSLAYANEPRTNIELRDHAGSLGEPVAADELWRRIRRYAPFVHVPTADPWSFGRRPLQIAAQAWTASPDEDEDAGLEHVVRSHLRSFGPSRMADVAQWSGLTVGRLRRGLERIEDLVHHEDEGGRELFDLRGAPLPDEETPAPPRLLPMWDETLLAYADRGRTLPEAYRKQVIVRNGDVLPSFTLNGYVAGLWWAEDDGSGRARIVIEPFDTLTTADRDALQAEGERLSRYLGTREPDVYRRYRYTRSRNRPHREVSGH